MKQRHVGFILVFSEHVKASKAPLFWLRKCNNDASRNYNTTWREYIKFIVLFNLSADPWHNILYPGSVFGWRRLLWITYLIKFTEKSYKSIGTLQFYVRLNIKQTSLVNKMKMKRIHIGRYVQRTVFCGYRINSEVNWTLVKILVCFVHEGLGQYNFVLFI